MNTKIIRYIWGYVLRIEAVFMLLPFIIGLIRHDEGFMWFLVISAGAALISIPLAFRKPTDTVFSPVTLIAVSSNGQKGLT